VDDRDAQGNTALMLAAARGQLAAVEALLAAGADPNARGPRRWTPLCFAAIHGESAVVTSLLRAGARAGARDEGGRTPAMLAAQARHDDVAALLR
jgi:ankyrin repeat protein